MGNGATLSISPAEARETFVLRGEVDLDTAAQVADIPVISTGRRATLTLDVPT